jgi:DNA-binding transcriptional regulator YiaG
MEENKIRKALEENNVRMSEFARAEGIPLRTFHNWCYGERKPAPYLERWCVEKIEEYAQRRNAEE